MADTVYTAEADFTKVVSAFKNVTAEAEEFRKKLDAINKLSVDVATSIKDATDNLTSATSAMSSAATGLSTSMGKLKASGGGASKSIGDITKAISTAMADGFKPFNTAIIDLGSSIKSYIATLKTATTPVAKLSDEHKKLIKSITDAEIAEQRGNQIKGESNRTMSSLRGTVAWYTTELDKYETIQNKINLGMADQISKINELKSSISKNIALKKLESTSSKDLLDINERINSAQSTGARAQEYLSVSKNEKLASSYEKLNEAIAKTVTTESAYAGSISGINKLVTDNEDKLNTLKVAYDNLSKSQNAFSKLTDNLRSQLARVDASMMALKNASDQLLASSGNLSSALKESQKVARNSSAADTQRIVAQSNLTAAQNDFVASTKDLVKAISNGQNAVTKTRDVATDLTSANTELAESEKAVAKAQTDAVASVSAVNDKYTEAIKARHDFIKAAREMGATEQQISSMLGNLGPPVTASTAKWEEFKNTIRTTFDNLKSLAIIQMIRRAISALVTALREGVKEAMAFQKEIALIRTIDVEKMGFQQWANQLRDLSDAFGIGIIDQAKAAYQALSNQVVGASGAFSFLSKANELAVSTGATTTDAINLLSSAINAYHLSASSAERISAQFFKTFELGRVTASELANILGRTAVPAKQLGIELAELNAAITVTTIAGVPVDESLTLIRNTLLKLIRPTEEMSEFFKEIGVNSGEAAIATYGYAGFLELLEKRAHGSSTELGELFGRIRAITGAMLFSGRGMDRFNNSFKAIIDSQKDYEEKVRIAMDSSAKQVEIATNKWSNFFKVNVGQSLLSVLAAITSVEAGFNTLIVVISVTAINAISRLIAYIGSMIVACWEAQKAAGAFSRAIALMGGGWAAGLTFVIGAIAAIAYAYESTQAKIVRISEETNRKINEHIAERRKKEDEAYEANLRSYKAASREILGKAAKYSGEVYKIMKDLTDNFKKINDNFKTMEDGIKDYTSEIISSTERELSSAEDAIISINDKLKDLGFTLLSVRFDQLIESIDPSQQIKKTLDNIDKIRTAAIKILKSIKENIDKTNYDIKIKALDPTNELGAITKKLEELRKTRDKALSTGNLDQARRLQKGNYRLLADREAVYADGISAFEEEISDAYKKAKIAESEGNMEAIGTYFDTIRKIRNDQHELTLEMVKDGVRPMESAIKYNQLLMQTFNEQSEMIKNLSAKLISQEKAVTTDVYKRGVAAYEDRLEELQTLIDQAFKDRDANLVHTLMDDYRKVLSALESIEKDYDPNDQLGKSVQLRKDYLATYETEKDYLKSIRALEEDIAEKKREELAQQRATELTTKLAFSNLEQYSLPSIMEMTDVSDLESAFIARAQAYQVILDQANNANVDQKIVDQIREQSRRETDVQSKRIHDAKISEQRKLAEEAEAQRVEQLSQAKALVKELEPPVNTLLSALVGLQATTAFSNARRNLGEEFSISRSDVDYRGVFQDINRDLIKLINDIINGNIDASRSLEKLSNTIKNTFKKYPETLTTINKVRDGTLKTNNDFYSQIKILVNLVDNQDALNTSLEDYLILQDQIRRAEALISRPASLGGTQGGDVLGELRLLYNNTTNYLKQKADAEEALRILMLQSRDPTYQPNNLPGINQSELTDEQLEAMTKRWSSTKPEAIDTAIYFRAEKFKTDFAKLLREEERNAEYIKAYHESLEKNVLTIAENQQELFYPLTKIMLTGKIKLNSNQMIGGGTYYTPEREIPQDVKPDTVSNEISNYSQRYLTTVRGISKILEEEDIIRARENKIIRKMLDELAEIDKMLERRDQALIDGRSRIEEVNKLQPIMVEESQKILEQAREYLMRNSQSGSAPSRSADMTNAERNLLRQEEQRNKQLEDARRQNEEQKKLIKTLAELKISVDAFGQEQIKLSSEMRTLTEPAKQIASDLSRERSYQEPEVNPELVEEFNAKILRSQYNEMQRIEQERVAREELIQQGRIDEASRELLETVNILRSGKIDQQIQLQTLPAFEVTGFNNILNRINNNLNRERESEIIRQLYVMISTNSDLSMDFKRSLDSWRESMTSQRRFTEAMERIANQLDKYLPNIPGHASGGMISGPGGTDNILSRLTSGEYVMPVAQTRRFYPQLEAMRRSGGAGGTGGSSVNVGGISVSINESSSPQATAKEVVRQINRGIRIGAWKIGA